MATSPNFGWLEPDNTDLVKNGALAIRTAVNAIDASMAELKGGTTGQVLSKTSATDMDFTWIAPASGASYVAGKNAFYNSAFDIWQRGTSSTGTAYNYTADRWLNYRGAFASGATFSRVASTQTGFQYALKSQRDLANAGTDVLHLRQGLETSDSLRFAGQTVTVSFYAKAGANFSPTSSILISTIYQGEGTDQAVNNMTGWTGVTAIAQNNTLTTSWQRFSQTTTISSAKTQIGIAFTYTPTGIAGADDSYQITGVQIETASTASGFSRQTGSIQAELAACQRYYWRSSKSETFGHHGLGIGKNGTSAMIDIKLPVTMRVKPTSIDFSAVAAYDSSSVLSATAVNFQGTQGTADQVALDVVFASGGTQFRPYFLISNNDTNGYIGLSAEL